VYRNLGNIQVKHVLKWSKM